MKNPRSHDKAKRELVEAALQARRTARRWLLGAIFLGLIGMILITLRSPERTEPPLIPTTQLEPAVRSLIDQALDQVRATPKSGEAWGRLATILMHYEFVNESAQSFVEAERRSPDDARWPYLHALLLMDRDPHFAVQLLQKSAGRAPPAMDMPQLRLAQFLAERGRLAEAQTEFRRLLDREPQHSAARLGLARVSQQEGRAADSIPLLEPALKDWRTRKAAHELLATAQGVLGRTNEARFAALTAAAFPSDPAWPDPVWDAAASLRVGLKASTERANALLDGGHVAEALDLLQATGRNYPADAETQYLLGWAFNQQQAYQKAELALMEYLRRGTNSPKGLAQLGVALLGQRRFAEAIPVLETARELKPTWRELHANLGYACVQLGRTAEAEGHYREAIAQDPNHVPAYEALAELLVRRGASAEARQVLETASRLALPK